MGVPVDLLAKPVAVLGLPALGALPEGACLATCRACLVCEVDLISAIRQALDAAGTASAPRFGLLACERFFEHADAARRARH
jgi:hypothetical protein